MKKSKVWLLVPFLVLLTLLGLFGPVLFSSVGGAEKQPDTAVFQKFQANYAIGQDGNALVTQTIQAFFPTSKHGIYEFFDISDRANPGVRYEPKVLSVTLDGEPEPWQGQWSGNKYYSIKIGDEYSTLPRGQYTYVIKYSLTGVISPVTAGQTTNLLSNAGTAPTGSSPDQSAFFFNVIGQGWSVPIQQALVTLQLPSAATSVGCTAGSRSAGSSNGPCVVTGVGTKTVTLAANNIPANTGMTARTTMDMAPPPRATLPWSVTWDRMLGRSIPAVIFVVLLSIVGLIIGILWSLRAREKQPGFPVMYEPPTGLGPVETYYMAYESLGSKDITATMYYLADKGLVKLEQHGKKSWLVTGTAPQEKWNTVDAGAQAFGHTLGVDREGYWFLAEKSEASGKTLLAAQKAQKNAVEAWATGTSMVKKSGFEKLGRLLFLVAVVAAAAFFVFFSVPSMWGLPFACFAIGAVGLMATGVGTRRTKEGRVLWSKAGGFERFLSTPSSEDRFDFAAKKDLFISYIPYAVAFGVADKWADKYKAYTHEDVPDVPWFPYGYAMMYGAGLSGMGSSFESTLESGISSYNAAQSSSSSGGGFGGGGLGGGGGGGGGGSW